MKLFITSIFFLLNSQISFSQSEIDMVLKESINNKGLLVWRYNRTNEGWLRTKAENDEVRKKTLARKEPMKLYTVTSVSGIEADSLVKKYSKKLVVKKLYELLQDTTKDLHAHLLLTEILDPYSLDKVVHIGFDRKEWLIAGRREADINHWAVFLKKENYIE